MIEAISYKRFSSPKQARGDSERRQTDLTQDYCERHQLKLVDTYLDAGLSAFTGQNLTDRGALRALLDAAKLGKFKPGTHLIVESFDRLSRQEISSAVRLFLDILDTGLVIVTLIDGEQIFTKERIDNDLAAIVIAIVFLARANNESRTKRERALQIQKTARQKARERKIPMPVEAPRWLTVVGKGDDRHFVVDTERARVVQHIFKMAASGMGQIRIARHLNNHRVFTLGGKSKWRPSAVEHVLRSQSVFGLFHPRLSIVENGERRWLRDPEGPIEGYFPVIVSKALFDQARAGLHARRRYFGRRVIPARSNLVAPLGRCALCGGNLFFSQTMDGFAYLRCVDVRERDCTNRLGFPYRKLEAVLLALDDLTELVAKIVKDPSIEGGPACHFTPPLEYQNGGLIDSDADDHRLTLEERKGFLARFKEAKAMVASADIEERHLARWRLVSEFRAIFTGIVLHPNRLVTLHLRPDANACRVVYALGSSGIQGIQVKMPEGTTGFIARL